VLNESPQLTKLLMNCVNRSIDVNGRYGVLCSVSGKGRRLADETSAMDIYGWPEPTSGEEDIKYWTRFCIQSSGKGVGSLAFSHLSPAAHRNIHTRYRYMTESDHIS